MYSRDSRRGFEIRITVTLEKVQGWQNSELKIGRQHHLAETDISPTSTWDLRGVLRDDLLSTNQTRDFVN